MKKEGKMRRKKGRRKEQKRKNEFDFLISSFSINNKDNDNMKIMQTVMMTMMVVKMMITIMMVVEVVLVITKQNMNMQCTNN